MGFYGKTGLQCTKLARPRAGKDQVKCKKNRVSGGGRDRDRLRDGSGTLVCERLVADLLDMLATFSALPRATQGFAQPAHAGHAVFDRSADLPVRDGFADTDIHGVRLPVQQWFNLNAI